MALFRIGPLFDNARLIRGEGVYLRPAEARDFPAWAALREESRAFLTPWEPTWSADELSRAAFRRRLRRHAGEIARGEALPLLIFRAADDRVVGGLTLGMIRRGVAQAATLGYWIGASHARQGLMTRAVAAAAGHAFESMALHRVEAGCLAHNVASRKLLERVGFRYEGLARSYLRIAGEWQDHLLFARLDSDPPPELRR